MSATLVPDWLKSSNSPFINESQAGKVYLFEIEAPSSGTVVYGHTALLFDFPGGCTEDSSGALQNVYGTLWQLSVPSLPDRKTHLDEYNFAEQPGFRFNIAKMSKVYCLGQLPRRSINSPTTWYSSVKDRVNQILEDMATAPGEPSAGEFVAYSEAEGVHKLRLEVPSEATSDGDSSTQHGEFWDVNFTSKKFCQLIAASYPELKWPSFSLEPIMWETSSLQNLYVIPSKSTHEKEAQSSSSQQQIPPKSSGKAEHVDEPAAAAPAAGGDDGGGKKSTKRKLAGKCIIC